MNIRASLWPSPAPFVPGDAHVLRGWEGAGEMQDLSMSIWSPHMLPALLGRSEALLLTSINILSAAVPGCLQTVLGQQDDGKHEMPTEQRQTRV